MEKGTKIALAIGGVALATVGVVGFFEHKAHASGWFPLTPGASKAGSNAFTFQAGTGGFIAVPNGDATALALVQQQLAFAQGLQTGTAGGVTDLQQWSPGTPPPAGYPDHDPTMFHAAFTVREGGQTTITVPTGTKAWGTT